MEPHNYGDSLLLAVSGGVDSMVMAELFLHCSAAYGERSAVNLSVAHCNFHLRGEESDGDELHVREWASSHNLPCYVASFDTRGLAADKGISIEMAARELRYGFFEELCVKHGFAGTCVAHNADDNAETLILNLVRGTGLDGACAMGESVCNPCGHTKVFRPLLSYTRDEIKTYALKWGVRWREDSTNAENDARRNVVRNQVFPLLKQLNPSLVKTFNADISHFCQAKAIVDASVKPLEEFINGNTIDLQLFMKYPFWEYSLLSGMLSMGFNPSVTGSLVKLLKEGPVLGGRLFYSEKMRVVTSSGSLFFETLDRGQKTMGAFPLQDEGAHKEISVELLDWQPGADARTPRGTILLDADAVGGSPVLRRWESGDWLIPIGMKGKKKVSDMLTDLKYNISQKDKVLVVEGSGHHVLAVVGERTDCSAAVTPSTLKVYRITIE